MVYKIRKLKFLYKWSITSVSENITVKNEIKILLVSENINEQIAVKSKNCMRNQFES